MAAEGDEAAKHAFDETTFRELRPPGGAVTADALICETRSRVISHLLPAVSETAPCTVELRLAEVPRRGRVQIGLRAATTRHYISFDSSGNTRAGGADGPRGPPLPAGTVVRVVVDPVAGTFRWTAGDVTTELSGATEAVEGGNARFYVDIGSGDSPGRVEIV